MKTRKYEQPTLELVSLAANDILLTSGDEALPEFIHRPKARDRLAGNLELTTAPHRLFISEKRHPRRANGG